MMAKFYRIWGTTSAERDREYACDRYMPHGDTAFRGITVNADPGTLFRWLCQMRIAPYSYDWIDNFGKQSPRQLTPGLEQLANGQTIMTIFDLLEFTPNEQLTIRMKQKSPAFKLFGDVAVTYQIFPESDDCCRLIAKIVVKYPSGIWGRMRQQFLIFGDFIMMRRQLLNFKKLAETK